MKTALSIARDTSPRLHGVTSRKTIFPILFLTLGCEVVTFLQHTMKSITDIPVFGIRLSRLMDINKGFCGDLCLHLQGNFIRGSSFRIVVIRQKHERPMRR